MASLEQIAIEALQQLGQVSEPKIATPRLNIIDLDEAFQLFAENDSHKAALPYLLKKKQRAMKMKPNTVAFRPDEDGSAFFDGNTTHLECFKVLHAAGLVDMPREIQPWKDLKPNGKPQMRHGKEVVRKPRLCGQDLSGMDFSGVKFTGVDFYQASGDNVNFEGAKFVNCRMNNTRFTNSNFRNAKFQKMAGKRHNQGHLRWIDLRGSDVSFADFSGADIREGNFSLCTADGTDFRGTNAIATQWWGVKGAPIVENLFGESKFSYEMRGTLGEGDMAVCHRLPESISAVEWRGVSEDTRRRLLSANLVKKTDSAEEWELTETAQRLRAAM
jgi:uncharacterized protein YjbI with pentapeptide repeats